MRRTYRKNNFKELNRQIVLIGLIFIVFVALGSYLNKIWPSYQDEIIKDISFISEYYNSREGIKEAILSNLKIDLSFMACVAFFSVLVITFPVVLIIFMLKGLSIGYTINSMILALNFESIKMIFVLFMKNLAIIPGTVILTLVAFDYVKKMLLEIKHKRKENMIFLVKRFILNVIIIISITVILQVVLNTISIGMIKFLVR